jgi:hypothetical protein
LFLPGLGGLTVQQIEDVLEHRDSPIRTPVEMHPFFNTGLGLTQRYDGGMICAA